MKLGPALSDRAGRLLDFLWSGWAGLAALSLLAAAWQAGHEAWGDFILPAPLETVGAAVGLLGDPDSLSLLLITAQRSLTGFAMAAGAGVALGLTAGYAPAVMRLARPLLTVVLGVPPIAWIVLTMMWFGTTGTTVAVAILIAATPVVFVAAAEGIATRDRELGHMAEAFGYGLLGRFLFIDLRQASRPIFPALALALGTSFKVAIMAEMLANAGGVGGALARARALLDVPQALAWVVLSVIALIVVEYGLVRPMEGELERWRRAAQPWGVKR
ncbi:ABC transporter permease [Maritimibacter dapengensis]|uniref:ABC transporter permease subunit n=1 Tax=Maritimibacter dapengensis TaxID=2836868 RepID=A0ABS6SXG3_9RHOB|nr:ABC transporter permease subunit [Maritimibacter dapengensis]MBV7377594.1 ABC transporter permease subunit [Maritimibacter dapengensis]